ncbi:uncharacterized protein BDR25DRAFT_352170 [Lindgomyces ingoldianus]|uniref:Uncharacterized protein n=1 Tax=Lindgomyces ingoldianus TaxID=673940 RepID=A0ACB6R4I4_9PLEO|nr:uncharacterized protein BDR25DRAFT_352170 [Lindgomyces ingoldianus]KAF2473680.1 hypothetical protein BDR25DRAFT_352170 [Lindgomyces ingoldianus]
MLIAHLAQICSELPPSRVHNTSSSAQNLHHFHTSLSHAQTPIFTHCFPDDIGPLALVAMDVVKLLGPVLVWIAYPTSQTRSLWKKLATKERKWCKKISTLRQLPVRNSKRATQNCGASKRADGGGRKGIRDEEWEAENTAYRKALHQKDGNNSGLGKQLTIAHEQIAADLHASSDSDSALFHLTAMNTQILIELDEQHAKTQAKSIPQGDQVVQEESITPAPSNSDASPSELGFPRDQTCTNFGCGFKSDKRPEFYAHTKKCADNQRGLKAGVVFPH